MFLQIFSFLRLAIEGFVKIEYEAVNLFFILYYLTVYSELSDVCIFVVLFYCSKVVSSDLFSFLYMFYSGSEDDALSFVF